MAGEKNFLKPEQVILSFGLEKGDHVADFGAGHGHFVIPIARLVGGNGRVYAVDIQKSALDVIRSSARAENLLNVETIMADLEKLGSLKIKNDFIDFVIVSNILFQVEDKANVFAEAWRVMRSGSRMAVIEWEKDAPASLGPPVGNRIGIEEVRKIAESAGFEFDAEFETGGYHYGLFFVKK